MNKMLLGLLLIALISWLLSPFAWWMFAVPAFIVPLILKVRDRKAFLMSFLAVGCLNLICIGATTVQNEGILSEKIGAVFQGLPGTLIVVLSILIPALLAGMCGWAAAPFRQLLQQNDAAS